MLGYLMLSSGYIFAYDGSIRLITWSIMFHFSFNRFMRQTHDILWVVRHPTLFLCQVVIVDVLVASGGIPSWTTFLREEEDSRSQRMTIEQLKIKWK
jgi:hypothetical protein